MTLSQQAAAETCAVADFAAFTAYFERFLGSLPWFLRHRLPKACFRVKDSRGTHYWCVDPHARSVAVVDSAPESIGFEVHAAVLNDCARLKMFSVWTASKRLKIHLPSADALAQANLWFTLLDLYEVDQLPIRKNFSLRALAVRSRRWREPVEVATILLSRLVLRRRFSVSAIYPLENART
jgi:hypothetical protein